MEHHMVCHMEHHIVLHMTVHMAHHMELHMINITIDRTIIIVITIYK